MPRDLFDICNDIGSRDDEGIELSDLDAVRHQVRCTLPALLQDIEASQDAAPFCIDVRDACGRRVVTSKILMIMQNSILAEQPGTSPFSATRFFNQG